MSELVALALVIALSPLSVIPAVLTLVGPRPRPVGLAYLLGWLVTLAVLTQLFVEVSGLLGGLGRPPAWASALRIAIGVALLALGARRWLTRSRAAHGPKWLRGLSSMAPPRALLTAAALVLVNPKVLFVCAAAGLAIGTEGVGRDGAAVRLAVFVAIAGSSVALPVLAYLAAGARLDAPLARLRDWLDRQHGALVAAILVVIGIMVLYKGIHSL